MAKSTSSSTPIPMRKTARDRGSIAKKFARSLPLAGRCRPRAGEDLRRSVGNCLLTRYRRITGHRRDNNSNQKQKDRELLPGLLNISCDWTRAAYYSSFLGGALTTHSRTAIRSAAALSNIA